MSERSIDFTHDRYRVLALVHDGVQIPHAIRHVAISLEGRRLVRWVTGGNFQLEPEGAALLESWRPWNKPSKAEATPSAKGTAHDRP